MSDSAIATAIKKQIAEAAGSLKAFIERSSPRNLTEKIALALEFANGECDLIQDIVRTKRTFYAAGFSATFANPDGSEMEDEWILAFNNLVNQHQLQKVAQDLVFDFCACQNCILHWHVQGSELKYVQTLDIRDIDWNKTVGTALMTVKIAEATVQKIRWALGAGGVPKEKLLDTYSEKIIDAIIAKKNVIELRPEDGDFWMVYSDGRKFSGLVAPTMQSIFADASLRELLVAGDFSVAFLLKAAIFHVTAGESISQGPRAGTKDYWLKEGDRAKLQTALTKLGKAMILITDHTVKLNHVAPDAKLFDPIKYLKVEERIRRWGSTPEQLLTGEGEGFAQGSMGGKRFSSEGVEVRKHIGWMLSQFLTHESMRSVVNIQEGAVCTVDWDWNNLKEWKQALEELNSAWSQGMCSNETYQERVGLSRAVEKKRKEREQSEAELWRPLFEAKQGMLTPDDKGGRPDEGGGKSANDGPRPSRGE